STFQVSIMKYQRSIPFLLFALGFFLAGCNQSGGKQITVAMMPKSKGNAYFISCKKGAEEAAKELGAKLLWDGPTEPDPAKQNEIVETWITRGADVIAVAVRSEEHTSELQSLRHLVCRLLLEKKKTR